MYSTRTVGCKAQSMVNIAILLGLENLYNKIYQSSEETQKDRNKTSETCQLPSTKLGQQVLRQN